MRGRRPRARRSPPSAPTAPGDDAVARWWARPQVLLPAVGFVLALAFAVSWALDPAVPAPPAPPASSASVARAPREVRFVLVDEFGLERPAFATVELASDAAADPGVRLRAALAAMRDELVGAGRWPESVPAPTGFVFELERQRVAVVDVERPAPGDAVPVATELAALRSMAATARAEAGADAVQVIVAGSPSASLWGRVATDDPGR